ncbi:MAG: hypothetical protein ACP5KW_09500 [Thermoproteota archaeon]
MSKKNGEEKKIFLQGLTIISVAAVIFGLVVTAPVLIFLYLAVGSLGGVRFIPVFVTLLLFTEVGRLLRRYITSQEAYIIYFMLQIFGDWLATGGMFGDFILRYYYRSAQYTVLFGVADKLPFWYVPALNTYGPLHRTFISSEWVLPFLIAIFMTVSSTMIDYGISFITTMLYIDIENLPFPVAPIDVEAISTLTERTPEKLMYFSFAAIISLVYEFFVYGIPSLTSVFLGTQITVIPYPWVDLTPLVEKFLPGAVFAIGTDISQYMVGWLIPSNVAIWTFIGSITFWVFGNAVALKVDHPYFRMWKKEWTYGCSFGWWYQRAMFDLWASPSVGFAIGAALAVFVLGFSGIIKVVQSLKHLTSKQLKTSYLPFSWILILIVVGSIGGMVLSTTLVPELWFIWVISWILIPFLQGLLAARSIGETGLGIGIPYVQQALLVPFSKPGDPTPWVVPFKATSDAGIITHRVKVARLLGANPLDYYKAYLIFLPIAIVISFVFWSIFWSMAPIPSAFYPWSAYSWPVTSLNFVLWVSRSTLIFKLDVIALTTVFAFLIVASSRFFPSFFSPLGLIIGFQGIPPTTFPIFIGALLDKYLERRFGKERWETSRSVIIAGTFAGIALAIAIAVAVTMVGRAITSRPF